MGITLEPVSSQPLYNPCSLDLQTCETGDSIRLFAGDFGLLIQMKSTNLMSILLSVQLHPEGGSKVSDKILTFK